MQKRTLLIILLIIDLIASAVIGYKIFSSKNTKNNQTAKGTKDIIQNAKETMPPGGNSESTNFLLLGYGGAGHDGGNLSDVIIVINVNPIRKQASIISIPRDLWVQIPIRSDLKQNFKINAAYAIGSDDRNYGLKEPQYKGDLGGGNMAKSVVNGATGLKINNYVSVDFESFKKIIDTLGSINVDVPVSFDDYSYPIKGLENETCGFTNIQIDDFKSKYTGFDLEKQFTCRYEHLHFDKGRVVMDGDTTLKFVRSRHSSQDGGDFARSRRQKAVLIGMKDKLVSVYAVSKIEELYKQFKGLVRTDLDLAGIRQLSQVFGAPTDYKIKFIGLSEENVLMTTKSLDGQFILIPKAGENVWQSVQKYISDQISLP